MLKKNKRKLGFFIAILLPINIFLLSTWDNSSSIRNEQLNKEYPEISRDTTFIAIVDSLFEYDLSNPKGSVYIRLSNGGKFVAISNSRPTDKDILDKIQFDFDKGDLKDLNLSNLLHKGDTIYKPAGKDSLIVLRGNMQYIYFLPTKEFSDSIFNRTSKYFYFF